MTRRLLSVMGAAAFLAACSSGNREVETGPDADPSASVILAGGVDGHAAAKNPNASTAARLGIPPGHLPPPGLCKVWMPGEPPGQQKKRYKAGNCELVRRQVPPGGWLVYNLNGNKKEIVVREYGDSPSRVLAVRIFDAVTGSLLWEEAGDGR